MKNNFLAKYDNGLFLKLKVILFFILATLVMMFLLRVWFVFGVAGAYFSKIEAYEFLIGALNGVRYDLATLSRYFMPWQLLFLLPINSRAFIKFYIVLDFLFLFSLITFSISDIFFFGMFSKHITSEITTARGNMEFMVPFVAKEYGIYIAVAVAIFGVAVALGFRYINKKYVYYKPNIKNISFNIVAILLITFLTIVGTRGKISFHSKPIKVMDASMFGSDLAADISVMGVFPTVEFYKKFKNVKLKLEENEAIALAKAHIVTENEAIHDENYPLSRVRLKNSLGLDKKNVVIIFFESWYKEILEKYPNAAPNYHKIKSEGLYFNNFYNMGSRSLLGVTAFLFSVPYVANLPYVNGGLEINNFPRFAKYFNDMGYNTLFVQTDTRSAEKMNEIAPYMKFKEFYGKEDIPLSRKYPDFYKGFDMDGLEFFVDKIDKREPNNQFLAVFYTSSTHAPYDALLMEDYKLYDAKTEEEAYLNRLYYSDAALGKFFEAARTKDWFDDTIFILMPDHRAIFQNAQMPDVLDRFNSFLVVYSPKIFNAGVDNIIATQDDILPTVLDIIGTKDAYSSSGSSLFDKNRRNVKYIYGEDGFIYIVKPDGARKIRADDANLENEEERTAVALSEALYQLIKNDKWMKKGGM